MTAKHLFCKRCGICAFYRPRSNPDGYAGAVMYRWMGGARIAIRACTLFCSRADALHFLGRSRGSLTRLVYPGTCPPSPLRSDDILHHQPHGAQRGSEEDCRQQLGGGGCRVRHLRVVKATAAGSSDGGRGSGGRRGAGVSVMGLCGQNGQLSLNSPNLLSLTKPLCKGAWSCPHRAMRGTLLQLALQPIGQQAQRRQAQFNLESVSPLDQRDIGFASRLCY